MSIVGACFLCIGLTIHNRLSIVRGIFAKLIEGFTVFDFYLRIFEFICTLPNIAILHKRLKIHLKPLLNEKLIQMVINYKLE